MHNTNNSGAVVLSVLLVFILVSDTIKFCRANPINQALSLFLSISLSTFPSISLSLFLSLSLSFSHSLSRSLSLFLFRLDTHATSKSNILSLSEYFSLYNEEKLITRNNETSLYETERSGKLLFNAPVGALVNLSNLKKSNDPVNKKRIKCMTTNSVK